jgi:glycosyltransferase involved in cell wall biosynthesis
MNNILIDFERLKYPNTGLYTFCHDLGISLLKKKNNNQRLTFYLPENRLNLFGENENYYVQKSWHKFLRPKFSEFTTWHATNQVSNYIPYIKNQKLLFTIHDLNFLIEKKEHPNKISQLINKIQKNIDKSTIITTISEYVKGDIEKHFNLSGKKIKVIYNGGCISNLDTEVPHYTGRPFLFTLGTVLPKKNFHVLIPLLSNNDFNLVIAGNLSSKGYLDEILNEAKKYGVSNRLMITGPISESQKLHFYKNCEAFLFPSIAEGFGIPVIEAMSFGKPIFLSKHTSLPEIGGNVAYYFDSFDPMDMRQTLDFGLNHFKSTNPSEEIIQQANKFSWDKAAEEYLDLYESITNY